MMLSSSTARSISALYGSCLMAQVVRPSLSHTTLPRSPLQPSLSRHYNRQAYKKAKKLAKALKNQDDITFADSVEILRNYALRRPNIPVVASVQLGREAVGLSAEPTPSSSSTSAPNASIATATKQFKGEVILPHVVASGAKDAATDNIILVFAKGEQAETAKALGAQIVGGEELIPEILAGKIHFTRCLSTKAMFPHVIKIAKILGPKGLMPSPGKGTVSEDVASMMASMSASTPFISNASGRIDMEIGQSSWKSKELYENMTSLLKAVSALKPAKVDASKFIVSKIISLPGSVALTLPRKAVSNDGAASSKTKTKYVGHGRVRDLLEA